MMQNHTEKINRIYKIEKEARTLQEEVLKEMIQHSKYESVRQFLTNISESNDEKFDFTDFLNKLNHLRVWDLDIGTKVDENFDKELRYSVYTVYNDYENHLLTFTLDDSYEITSIQYEQYVS